MTEADLNALVRAANLRYAAMTPEQQTAMWKAQRDSFVRSITDWPRPNYKWVNGVKVYASYADYCND